MFNSTFKQTNAYAMQLGALFGLLWSVGFACLIGGFTHPSFHDMFIFLVLSTPAIGILLIRHFEQQVRIDGQVNYGRAYLFSFLMYLYATILLAGICYAYLRIFDNGNFAEANIAYLHRPEVVKMLHQEPWRSQTEGLLLQTGFKSFEDIIRHFYTPILFTANIVDLNIFLGLILSLPTALFGLTRSR